MHKILPKLTRHSLCLLVVITLLGTQCGWALSPTAVHFQDRTVSGRVTSTEDGQGFPGANVIVKGTTIGTTTDAEGNFTLKVPSDESVLIFSAIGFTTEERTVGTQTVIDISMTTDITTLTEVVVVGYGSVKKTDVTGSLVSINEKTLRERPTQNVLQALQGKASGVNVTSNMKPGEVPAVTIRGARSITATNAPLYVIDGIPLMPGDGNSDNGNSASPPMLSDINPNDIASMEILKDASATAIYGSRGANGVVLITTKKGTKGKMTVSYNATVSLDSYKSLTKWMNAGQYVDQHRLGLRNGGQYAFPYPDPVEDRTKMGFANDPTAVNNVLGGYEWVDGIVGGTVVTRPTTQEEQDAGWPANVPVYNAKNIKTYDWLDAATRQGVTNNHQLALSAGSETSRLYLSLTAFDQKGVQKDQDYNRYNGLISGDITPNKWLTLGLSSNIAFATQNYGMNGPSSNTGAKDFYGRAAGQFPYAQPYDANGVFIKNAGGDINNFNPLIDIDQSINERKSTSILASMFTEVKFTPWLKYRLNFGTQYRDYRTGTWGGPSATSSPNRAGYDYDQRFTYTLENLLYADKTFADVHTFGLTLLQSVQKNRQEGLRASVSNTVKPTSLWYDIAANSSATPPNYGSSFSEYALMSYMARLNYTLNNKYLLTVSARSDGASVLAPGNKWDFFPSAALAWKMQEENFLQSVTWIDELKLRGSYGVVGNASVGAYQTGGPLSQNPYVFGSTAAIGFLPQVPGNPDLRWERSATWNVGLDFAVVKGRVTGSIEVYETNTSDLLLDKSINPGEGYVNKTQNIGKTRNKGVDVTLSAIVIDKPDFGWTLDINWSKYKNEVVELINGKEDMLANRLFIGQPIDVYYNYDNAGIWGNSAEDLEEIAKFKANNFNFAPGTVRVVDQPTVDTDGDGKADAGDYRIDANDYVIRGTSNPKWTGGLTTSFRYKNWSLSSFIYARVGQTYFGSINPNPGFRFPNGRVENDYWSPTNTDGKWPQPTTAAASAALNIPTAMQYANGSFATVRNIALAYTFPQAWLSRVALKDLQLSVQVLNPFIFGGETVKLGINPDDTSNWSTGGNKNVSTPNSNTAQPVGGINNNTILPQSIVFGLRTNF